MSGIVGSAYMDALDIFPAAAKIIQVDVDAKMLGLVKPISVGINGDAKSAALALSKPVRYLEKYQAYT